MKTSLLTFLCNCHAGIESTARKIRTERAVPAVLTAMQVPIPTMLGRTPQCSTMFAPLYVVDTHKVLRTLFGLPDGTIVAVYR
jgi:hypothetical protein